jgi:hypothetical protein
MAYVQARITPKLEPLALLLRPRRHFAGIVKVDRTPEAAYRSQTEMITVTRHIEEVQLRQWAAFLPWSHFNTCTRVKVMDAKPYVLDVTH